MWRRIHQSYFFVATCAGIVAGIILANFWTTTEDLSWSKNGPLRAIFLVCIIIILLCAYFYPRRLFIIPSFAAGIIIGLLRGGQGTALKVEDALAAKDWFANRINSVLPEDAAKLCIAYLLGTKADLQKSFTEALRVAGLSHIVVASGAHLSILLSAARKIFGKISRRAGLIFALVFIFSFMAVVGFSPSIMRAGLTSTLSLLAWYSGRKFTPARIILIVMTITLLIEPGFVTNLGWQLSFASFGGIMILAPRLTEFFYGKNRPGFFAKMLITTAAATIATAPISLYYFGTFSIISFAANLIILPTLPYAMGLTFGAGLVGNVPIIGNLINGAAAILISFHIKIIEFFGAQEMFLIQVPTKNPAVFLLYLPVAIYLIRQKQIKMVKLNKINWRKHVRTQ